MECQGLATDRMLKGQTKGMQALSCQASAGGTTVQRVANQGVPHRGHVHTDLMGPTSLKCALHPTHTLAGIQQ